MLDRDLASIYGVETRTLNQTVKRNVDRFLEDLCSNCQKMNGLELRGLAICRHKM